MSKPSRKDLELAAAMGARRPAAAIAEDVASTMLGQEAQELKNALPVALDLLVESPYQCRSLSEAHVDHLVASIEGEGLLTPILLRPVLVDLVSENTGERRKERRYEIVAGHHRVAAFRRLGRSEIPALVRTMADFEAARALASENTARANLTDYQLYLHMAMLRGAGKVKSNSEMARLLNFSRTKVVYLESFGQLPPAARDLLAEQPDLLGYNVVYQLASANLCAEHPELVVQGVARIAEGRMQQGALPEWVSRKAAGVEEAKVRREVFGAGALEVRLSTSRGGLTLTSSVPLDFDRVKALIEQHLDQLLA
ncbi:MAG: ParB/RepB/Spo0J family partition protein [Telluria sp.]